MMLKGKIKPPSKAMQGNPPGVNDMDPPPSLYSLFQILPPYASVPIADSKRKRSRSDESATCDLGTERQNKKIRSSMKEPGNMSPKEQYITASKLNPPACSKPSDIANLEIALKTTDQSLQNSTNSAYKDVMLSMFTAYKDDSPLDDNCNIEGDCNSESASNLSVLNALESKVKESKLFSEDCITPLKVLVSRIKKMSNAPNIRDIIAAAGTSLSPHICEVCGTSFSSSEELDSHATMGECLTTKVLVCSTCNDAFLTPETYYYHRRQTGHDKYPWRCDECGKVYKTQSYLKEHQKVHRRKNYVCVECGESFSKIADLRSHILTHPDIKPYFCGDCGQMFTQLAHLQSHSKKHAGKKSFECKVCGQSFGQNITLQNHERTHTKAKPHICKYCNKGFSQLATLINHTRTHTGEKPFPCAECGKCFAQLATMKEHVKTHSGERPHECQDCGKRFAQLGTLINHARTHSKTKPYKCSVCDHRFAQHRALEDHLKTHTGEKPFMCAECGKSFAEHGTLNAHVKTHANKKEYECRECGKKYSSLSSRTRHEKVHSNRKSEVAKKVKSELSENSRQCDTSSKIMSPSATTGHNDTDNSGSSAENHEDSSPFSRQDEVLETDSEIPEAKPYACGVCGSCFSTVNDLETHILVH